MTTLISGLALLSAVLATLRPTTWSLFVAGILNAGALVYLWRLLGAS